MILQSFMLDVGTQEVNCYLLADEVTREGALVDAGAFEPQLVELAVDLGLHIGAVLLTHLHWDHVDGLPQYLEQWPQAVVYSPAPLETAGLLREGNLRLVEEGDTIAIGPFHFEVLKTSGHTPESISYYSPEAGVCFVGDALFAGSVGGTSNDAQHAEEIGHIKRKILILPDETEILSGHGPLTTVAIERQANPFLQPGFGRT